MAIVTTDDKHYKAIAAAIRNNSDVIDEIKPEEMADCVDAVARHNYYKGETDGVTLGRELERNDFWSVFQNYGNPTSYAHAFSGNRFTDENYNPQYPINCISSVGISTSYVFHYSPITDTKVEIIIGQNRELTYFFSGCRNLHTIRKITLTGNNRFASAFSNCHVLENITFEGDISNDISFADSPLLSKASITNIIGCLADTVSGKTLTLSIIAVAEGFRTDEVDGLGSDEWAALIATKPNWTISLV